MSKPRARRVQAPTIGVSISLLSAAMALASVVVYLTVLHRQPAPTHRFTIAWGAVAPMTYLAEVSLVHLHFRRDNHSFSLGEVSLVLALLFSPSWEIVAGEALGMLLAYGVHRRTSPLKLLFTL